MATSVPLTFRCAPFPEGYRATPEQFKNDLVARLQAETAETISFFASGSVEPSSNVGPWLKNGVEWYVWSDSQGQYIPQTINSASLGYIAANAAPDHLLYTFWIELDLTGKAKAIKYYSGGAWKDVYEDKFAAYDTSIGTLNTSITTVQGDITTLQGDVSAINTNLSTNYSTTTAMNAAIAAGDASTLAASEAYTNAAIAGIPGAMDTAPARGDSSGSQTVAVDNTQHKLNYTSEAFDPSGVYDAVNSEYICPATGYYHVEADIQLDNSGATASNMDINIGLNDGSTGSGISVASPPGDRWYCQFSALVYRTAGQHIGVYLAANDGVLSGSLLASNGQFSVFRIK